MTDHNEKSFQEMSIEFQKAFGYASMGLYNTSIPLYEEALAKEKNNFAILNNLGVAYIFVGIESKDRTTIEKGILLLRKAIKVVHEIYKYPEGYPMAEHNLQWATKELSKLK